MKNSETPNDISTTIREEALAVLSGLIGGGRYGLKIRVPHAFVMTFLFGRHLSLRKKFIAICKLAAEHASNLAAFACLYKLILAALKIAASRMKQNYGIFTSENPYQFFKLIADYVVNGPYSRRISPPQVPIRGPGLPEQPYHGFLAGALGGYFVWGRYSGVNYQLLLYLASRILVGCATLAREKGIAPFSWERMSFQRTYPLAAAAIWGTVMMLFEEYPEVLHPSLKRSMDEIYRFKNSFGSGSKAE